MERLTLAEVRAFSRSAAIGGELDRLLGSGARARPRATRLQAPVCHWAVYPGADGCWATLKSFFVRDAYLDYVRQLEQHYPDRLDAPQHPAGGVLLLPSHQAVLWRFPFDPSMPGLARSLNGPWVADVLRHPGSVEGKAIQYRPEVGAVVRYADGEGEPVAFGKVAPSRTIGSVQAITRLLWETWSSTSSSLTVPRPLAYRPEVGLLLQEPMAGQTVGRDRNRAIFLDLARHAGSAIASLHGLDARFGTERPLSELTARLRVSLPDVALTAPRLRQAFELLVREVEQRAASWKRSLLVPSHGDFKYDQFLEHEGRFAVIDFELFCQAERELDLGTFCAYLPNTTPRDWRESKAAEVLRSEFLRSYQDATGGPLDADRLTVYESAMLAIRALSHIWTRQRDWQLRAAQLLELGIDRLRGASD